MPDRLPLFPLGTVLFPGLALPLHVFEERYRQLVRDLLEQPESDRRFGVVAIKAGHEVGPEQLHAVFDVGCVAQVRRVQSHDDGRFELLSTGTERFRIASVAPGAGGYLLADTEPLGEPVGPAAAALVPRVLTAYRRYLGSLADARGAGIDLPELPADPLLVSYLIAATVLAPVHERQELLEAPDAASRLALELQLLRREAAMLRTLSAPPAVDLTRAAVSPN